MPDNRFRQIYGSNVSLSTAGNTVGNASCILLTVNNAATVVVSNNGSNVASYNIAPPWQPNQSGPLLWKNPQDLVYCVISNAIIASPVIILDY